jgi:hypothetical protein
MPIDYRKYPENWKNEIRPRILKRANNCCEFCGVENGIMVFRDNINRNVKIVLTIAHLDHDEENHNVKDERLAALCQLCHIRYDINEKRKRRNAGYKYSFTPLKVEDIEGENWLPVIGYEGKYLVSNMGRVRTISENSIAKNQSILSQHNHRKGYKIVSLWNGVRQNTFKVHRLVAIAFISNPMNLPEVNHKFGDKTDNRASQLEWVTSGDNQRHAYSIGLSKSKKGSNNGRNVIDENSVIDIYKSKETLPMLAKKYNVSKSCISHIKTGYTWGHLTYAI